MNEYKASAKPSREEADNPLLLLTGDHPGEVETEGGQFLQPHCLPDQGYLCLDLALFWLTHRMSWVRLLHLDINFIIFLNNKFYLFAISRNKINCRTSSTPSSSTAFRIAFLIQPSSKTAHKSQTRLIRGNKNSKVQSNHK